MVKFRSAMDAGQPGWRMAAVFGRINLYYLTGTMQDGMLLIPQDGEAVFWVRRSYERACQESLFPQIRPMESFRDAAKAYSSFPETIHIETEVVPVAMLERFRKYFPCATIRPMDAQLATIRTVKSEFELGLMKQSGEIHRRMLEEQAPACLEEGISEAEFAARLFAPLIQAGHHGVARFAAYGTDVVLGLVCFGENSLYPSNLNGPGGNVGLCAAVPTMGSLQRKLKKGDLVFVDIGCGVEGYHTDKTTTYVFGQSLPDEVVAIHQRCVDIQNTIAGLLKPGAIPSQIYKTIMDSLEPAFLENFMGYGERRVKFLGHGIGLVVDEMPVIAEGFDQPLQEGMALAIEPKKGIKGIGMVGIENTFIVTPEGGVSITGTHPGLIQV